MKPKKQKTKKIKIGEIQRQQLRFKYSPIDTKPKNKKSKNIQITELQNSYMTIIV